MLLLCTNSSEGWGTSPPTRHPHPAGVVLSQGVLGRNLSGHRGTPAQGTSVAWQKEVLDPGDNGVTLKVPRPQLQGVASLWGQDHQAPRKRQEVRKFFSSVLRASSLGPPSQAALPYLSPEQVQMETCESAWPCTPPW